ncbi:ABC-type transport system involved in multi-copper enzyme maturation permease subunit [Nonomuraea thailandensis]|uniref:ABC-type transport system involved in multi-copper enzyme maturation permease subunit n=1 Tax=Nonomuraea thailandensis TaxID=1188745 RepID=A0A9X2GRM5_9ACTN|nr:ABC transporter permease [Nonomuraea thailandensis]MCP2362194.1 ABC-type transport system involved in multi-copper enzyme maturation permease subunit [Nonomuraea thailandensis]
MTCLMTGRRASAILSAERHRLTASRLPLWGGAAALCSGAFIGLLALIGPENFQPPLPGLETEQGTRMLLGMLGILAFVPALIGTTAVAAEHRHQTITTTALFVPRRWHALLAKLAVYAVAGLGYGLLSAAVAGAALFAAAAVKGITLGLPAVAVLALLVRIALAMAAYTLLGVAVGALLPNQVAALAVLGGYFYLVETALLVIPGANLLYPYLPGGSAAALTGFTYLADAVATQTGGAAAGLLPAWLGAVVLLAYALLAALVAIAAPLRRDIT